ncbi:hypothetical protein [Mycobacterium phage CELFI]|uniref:Uncharacterized protein n=1 Tax=Mycobacterium phage CELFI TaxID=2769359 RepID=A0A7G9V460_9CAUD|nr:hypothetical protein J4T95_gp038 [Mycobacterium phage CELFI]QNO01066.1 hypothetical protein [Mycobacterium phage CELFI]
MLEQFHLANELTPLVDHALLWTLIAAGTVNQALRRHTWRVRWEIRTTASAALTLTALILLSPWLNVLNPLLPNTFTCSYIPAQFLIGHIALICAHAVFLSDLISRMTWSHQYKVARLNAHIGLPLTVALPTLVGLWLTGDHVAITPLVTVVYFWLLANTYWLFWCIRMSDPRTPLIVNLYLTATGIALTAPVLSTIGLAEGRWPWRITVVAAIVGAAAMSLSWTRKQRHLKAHMWKRIRAEKPLKQRSKQSLPKQLDGAA